MKLVEPAVAAVPEVSPVPWPSSTPGGTESVRGGPVGCCPLTAQPLDTDQAAKLAPVFKALGDPVRLRLLSLIAAADARSRGAAEVSANDGAGADGAVCVCELTGSFDLSAPTISHHLKVLRRAGLVESRRQGTWVYYRLRPEALAALGALLA